jgi:hypothetical protein
MKIYKRERRGHVPEFYPNTWSTEQKKTHTHIFVKGRGYIRVPNKQLTEQELEVAAKWSWAELRRVFTTYGRAVAYEYGRNKLPCAEFCIPIYITIAKDVTDAEALDELEEKTGFKVYKGAYKLAVFGIFLFPILEFDDYLHKEHGYTEEEHGSMKEFVTMKWGDDFCNKMESLWSHEEANQLR